MISSSHDPHGAPTVAVVLAAGLGKRFKADRPKVLFELQGKPLVHWVTDAAQEAGISRTIVVIGHLGEMVERTYGDGEVEFVWQQERLGTGHAVLQTELLLRKFEGDLLVLLGDAPLVSAATIRSLLATHRGSRAAATILTAEVDDPAGYGRVVRRSNGTVERIVEHRDADASTRQIREINSGAICFAGELLFPTLRRITRANDQQEYYLTDAIGLLCRDGHTVLAHRAAKAREVLGVNSPEELANLEEMLKRPSGDD